MIPTLTLISWASQLSVSPTDVHRSLISLLTVKPIFNLRKTKSSRDGAPLSGERAL